MLKFIKKILFFSIPIVIFIGVIEVLLRSIPNDYSFKKKYLDTNSEQIEVLYLGNSHIYFGVNPQFSSFKSFNASHISQSLNYDMEILKKFNNKWTNLKCVIIPIDYFTMFTTLSDGPEKWRMKNYNIYYGFSNDYNYHNYFELLNGKFVDNIKRLKSYFIANKSDLTSNELGWGTNYNSKDSQDLFETGIKAAQRHTIKNFHNEHLIENIKIINELVSFSKNKNVKIIFVTCPVYKSYSANLEKNQYQTSINQINKIVTQNKEDIFYYNLLNDDSFKETDFFDADHLNEKGAKKMTIKIDSIINKVVFKNQ